MIKANILIVEDELLIAKNIAKKLEKFGCNIVKIVASGKAAIQQASEASLDLILMDIAIKGKIDGIETANSIRKTVDTPIIFLTAYANDETLDRASKTGCYGYLIKPFRDKELQATVQITLSKYQEQSKIKKVVHSESKTIAKYNNVYRDEVTNLPNKLFLKDLFTYLSSLTDPAIALGAGGAVSTEVYSDLRLRSRSQRSNFKLIAVYNIYLDRFKYITKYLSQSQLNSLLSQVAQRLSNCVNGFKTHGATVYIESDNFVVLLALDTRLTATQYGQAISKQLREHFRVDEREICLAHDISVAFCPSDSVNIEELLQQTTRAIEKGVNRSNTNIEVFSQIPSGACSRF